MCTQHIAKYMLTLCLLAPGAVCKQFRHRSGSAWTCGCIVIFFAYQVILHSFKLSADFSPPEKFVFGKKIRNTLRRSSVLDPDQVLHFVWPDLGSNVLHMFSVDEDKSKVLMYTALW